MKPQQQTPPTSTEYVEPLGFKGSKGEWDSYLHDGNVNCGGIVVANCYSSLLSPQTIKANAKLISQSKELAKALQDIKNEGHKLLNLYANSDHYTEADMYKLFRTGVGNWIELAKQKLSEAGLTE